MRQTKKISAFLAIIMMLTLFVPLIQVKAVPVHDYTDLTNVYSITLGDGTATNSRRLGDTNLDGIYSFRDVELLIGYVERPRQI